MNSLTRRSAELVLLAVGAVVLVVLSVLFSISQVTDGSDITGHVVQNIGLLSLILLAFLIVHLALRFKLPNTDPALLPIVLVLSGIGIIFVQRLDPELAGRQVLWLFLGIAALLAVILLAKNFERIMQYKWTIFITGLLLLLVPALIGTELNGSKIWLSFGGFSFQPGEIAKICIVLFFAGYLADNREMLAVAGRRVGKFVIPDIKPLLPLLFMWIISLVIVIFERDLGSALLFFGLFLAMLYVATGRVVYVVFGLLFAVVGGFGAYQLFDHVQARVAIWLDPYMFSQTSGYQIVQADYSLADGGLFGSGIGLGLPDTIPVVSSDFIFVAIAEEMGLLGGALVALLFVLFAVRGLTISTRARTDVAAFAAAGFVAAICLQAFLIIGGTTRLIPLTGVTLPFMSQGGSSLLASFIILGFMLKLGHDAPGREVEMLGVPGAEGGILGRFALSKRIAVSITTLSVLFAVLFVNLGYRMVVMADEVKNLPSNSHTLMKSENAQRGDIISSDGVVLAYSREVAGGVYERAYPEGSLAAHVLGYSSTRFGASGVENSQSAILLGKAGINEVSSFWDALMGTSSAGATVQLTIDTTVQTAAEQAIKSSGHNGAAVVLDADTGAVKAMASAPNYDANSIEQVLEEAGKSSTANDGPLLNRATSALYAPGSSYKIVTLAAMLKAGQMNLESRIDSPAAMDIGGAAITNYENNAYGTTSIKRAFALSSNTAFAQIATDVGAPALVAMSKKLGFQYPLGHDFPVLQSLMPNPADMTEWETAWAGVGQPVGEHSSSPAGPQVTVMQMASVVATVANGGRLLNPYVVQNLVDRDGRMFNQTSTQILDDALTSDITVDLREAMLDVVENGTGGAAAVSGYVVRGKTGTAQTGKPADDSWFVGYIEVNGHKYVIALVLEQIGSGAAAYAKQILQSCII